MSARVCVCPCVRVRVYAYVCVCARFTTCIGFVVLVVPTKVLEVHCFRYSSLSIALVIHLAFSTYIQDQELDTAKDTSRNSSRRRGKERCIAVCGTRLVDYKIGGTAR